MTPWQHVRTAAVKKTRRESARVAGMKNKKCVPCEVGGVPLKAEEIQKLLSRLSNSWSVENNLKLKREFKYKDFIEAMKFVNKVADLAESEGHHPDLHIHYNKVLIELWTHAVGGLSENDFILAAKIDALES